MHATRSTSDYCHFLIIGGGFGACTALSWLARFTPANLRVTVLAGGSSARIVCTTQRGCGLAYANQDSRHLLNSAHWNMGLLDIDPDGFTRALSECPLDGDLPEFASRAAYGDFLQTAWDESLIALKQKGIEINIVHRDAIKIQAIRANEATVLDSGGTLHSCSALLVCEGPKLLRYDDKPHAKLISPLWPDGLARLKGARGHIAIIGTGLSGVDAAISALAERGVSKVTMISRNGRLPLGHDVNARQNRKICFSDSPLNVLRAVRFESASTQWQAVMNELRNQSNAIWRTWTVAQRRCALRHGGELWAAHRNRLPPDVLGQIKVALTNGRLAVKRGLASIQVTDDQDLCITLEMPQQVFSADWIIDARGFTRVTDTTASVCGRAIGNGHFATSELGYGVAADKVHRATPAHLAPVHVVGAPRLGDLIETTGAPEVRAQVRQSLEALFCPAISVEGTYAKNPLKKRTFSTMPLAKFP